MQQRQDRHVRGEAVRRRGPGAANTRRYRIKADHRANRRRQRAGHVDRARWRAAPATETQLRALRRIASETGVTFVAGITRGEAWRRIKHATRLVPPQHRAKCAPPWWTPPATQESNT